jgi:hypothetical protein
MGIISPKPNSFVGQGETVEIVVAGEESKPASTWQTGIRRLTLVEPAPAMNIQNSDETATSVCDGKQWTRQHSFRYVVPRDAQSGRVLTLKAAAEDGGEKHRLRNAGSDRATGICRPVDDERARQNRPA